MECCFVNVASVDVCKSVHEPGHAGTHPHPLARTVPCQSIVLCLMAAKDMTACFGAVDEKTIPQRVFSGYPNRPQLAASVYCDHRGWGYSREAWQGPPR